jgi:MFS family permease
LLTDTTSPPPFTGRQRLILLVLLGAGFMLSVDFSILNVALPQVGAGVGLGLTGLPWITAAYALVGGTLVGLLSWRAAFFINVPVAVAILLLTPFLIGESSLPHRVRLDLPGAVSVTGACWP